jgi:SanA protein
LFLISLFSQNMKRLQLFIYLIFGFMVVALLNYYSFSSCGEKHMVKKEQLDSIHYILVPGAGRYYPNGSRQNYAFLGRVDSSASLWHQYPHMKLILSGYEDDNYYQEAHDLLDALVLKGVPDSVCILDPNSADTYETLTFYKERFGKEPFVLISQEIHLNRALWMANEMQLNAYGYEAGGYPGGIPRWFVIKEIGSRLKARLEVWGLISHQRVVDPLS